MDNIYLFDFNEENIDPAITRISHVIKPANKSKVYLFSDEQNVHENCKCYINDDNKWIFGEDPCPECKSLGDAHNKSEDFSFELFHEDDKMQMLGVVLRPNFHMYRKSIGGSMKFTEKAVELFRESYKKHKISEINLEHKDNLLPAYVKEDFMLDEGLLKYMKNKYPKADLKKGDWVQIHQVTDKNYWEDVKKGKVSGFSPEIVSSAIKKIKEKFNMEYKNIFETKDGRKIVFEGDIETIQEGTKIFELVEGETKELADGEIELSEGEILVIEGGLVKEIKTTETDTEDLNEDVPSTPAAVEFISKEEFNTIVTDLKTRLEKLELELTSKTSEIEELSEQLKKSNEAKPIKSITLKKKTDNFSSEDKNLTWSQKWKQSLIAQGKF